MKSINFLIVLVFLGLAGCAKEPITGTVTCKEYTRAHWSTAVYEKKYISSDTVKIETSFGARGGKVGPQWIESKYKVCLTDNNKTRTIKTDYTTWSSIKCGQKISYDPSSKSFKN